MSRKQTLVSVVAIIALLLMLLGLGLGQQRAVRQQGELAAATEKLLFQYAIFREHLLESILIGQFGNISSMAAEVEDFRQNLAQVLIETGLSDSSQYAFFSQVDLSGLVLLLRETSSGDASPEKLRQLQRETRLLGERLLLFDRLVGERARRSLVSLQAVIIGIMALLLCSLLTGLLFFSRRRPRADAVAPTGQAELFRTSQLAALGELTGEVAHEINDLSNGVINYAQLLADELAECGGRPEAEKMLGRIIGAGERIGVISGEILACSENRDQGRESLELQRLVGDVLAMMKNRYRRQGVNIERRLPDNLPPVVGNRLQLQQLFVNLLLNAQQALDRRYPGPDENKRLEVSIEPVKDAGKDWLRAVIVDYGCGMDRETLREVTGAGASPAGGAGQGLGLRVCREIIHEHGGRLEISSQPGEGTRVAVDLPASAGTEQVSRPE